MSFFVDTKEVFIYDVSGRLIKHMTDTGNQTSFEISTETFSSGTYFIKFVGLQNEVIKKMIKR